MVYIIAEAGVDHEGSYDRALVLLNSAIKAKASCFKIQYYAEGFQGEHRELPWLSKTDIHDLKGVAESKGIDFLITPHDQWALDFIINETDLHQIKIGSGDWDLLPAAIDSGKEVIVSTGGHDLDEVMSIEDQVGGILYCVSKYPCPSSHLDFYQLEKMIHDIRNDIGFSDHTQGTACALAAVGMRAEIIEKHMTLERDIRGHLDTACSLLPHEWPKFVEDIRQIERALAY